VGGTICVSPTAEPIPNGVVLIRGGKISAVGSEETVQVPPTSQSLDCSGRTITAGFWNSHVYFFELKWTNAATIPAQELTKQLRDMLTHYGFTSVFDLGSPWKNTSHIRDGIEPGEVPGPRLRSTGEVLVAPCSKLRIHVKMVLTLLCRHGDGDGEAGIGGGGRRFYVAGFFV
jgi:hypothetical protein